MNSLNRGPEHTGIRALAGAVSLLLEDNRHEALRQLKEAVSQTGETAELCSALGLIQLELEQYQEAEKSYTRLLTLDPRHIAGQFNLAVCREKLGRWKEAAERYKGVLAVTPNHSEARLGLAICQLQLANPDAALENFTRVLGDCPDNDTALFGKAASLQLTSRLEEAANVYRHLLARNQNTEQVLTNLIGIETVRKDYQALRQYCDQLIRLQPASQPAFEGLATCAFAEHDYEAAARYCKHLVDTAPENFERWFNLGVANQKLGNKDHAAKAYAEAIRIRPDRKEAHVNLGIIRQELGDLKAAREAYERALQLSPDLAEVNYNLASILEQQGAMEEAERYYARLAAQSGESSEDACFRLGYLRLLKGDFRRSIDAFQSCVQKRQDWPEAYVNLGIANWRLGDRDQPTRAFEQSLALDPESLDALRGLAALSVEREEYDRALDLQAQMIHLGERTPQLLYNTGLLLQKTGQVDDAIQLYREAISQRSDFAEALLNLGHALKSKGEQDEARLCWKQALDCKPELAQGYFEQPVE